MNKFNLCSKLLFIAAILGLFANSTAQNRPTFNSDPRPNGKRWVRVNELTDEFNDNSLDTNKWRTTSSGGWIGRPPGLFETGNVSESNQNLRIVARKLPRNQTIDGQLFTHGGGYVESNNPATPRFDDPSAPGLYFECRMKANKTFLSSTFWFNNRRSEGQGCDRRVTELDIQECVGQLTGTSGIALRGWDRIMHSNAHSRTTTCNETPTGSSPVYNDIGENVSEDYHIYGAWWKSPREIVCYLDGVEFQTIRPKSDFDLNLYMRLVVETYDWNPTPNNNIMDFSRSERTTLYDWVRTWKLEDAPANNNATSTNDNTQYYLINRASNKKIRIRNTNNGSAIQQVPLQLNGTFTRWTTVTTDNGYFHLKNVASGMYFRPANDNDASTLIQRPTTYSGGYTQWRKINTDNGYFHLQNRATGKYFRPENANNYVDIQQRPTTYSGGFTQWKLVAVGSNGKNLNISETNFKFYPNPTTDILNLEATGTTYNVEIYNLSGAAVKSLTVEEGEVLETSVSNLTPGMYMIHYSSNKGDKTFTEKLVVQ